MKKLLTIFTLALLLATQVSAQESKKLRKKYINLSYATQTLTPSDNQNQELKSKYGAAFTVGRSYFLHKKPIAGMIRFGIDATWFDINYGNYSQTITEPYEGENEVFTAQYHQAELAMQVGPSVTINPIGKLNAHIYCRFAPSFSAIYVDEEFMGNYASFIVAGGAISYGVIGLGIETRSGSGSYKNLFGGDDNEGEEASSPAKTKLKTSGMRVYLSFRF